MPRQRAAGLTLAGMLLATPGLSASADDVAEDNASTTSEATDAHAEPWVKRVGGDLDADTQFRGGRWRSGPSFIEDSLAQGYADPTPPGAIDVKFYPSVRRAQMTQQLAESNRARNGGTRMFMPLFRHISSRDIAMTSPVENEYTGLSVLDAAGDLRMRDGATESMTFIYRTPELGPTGRMEDDPRVTVIDTEPVTVASIGTIGRYGMVPHEESRKALVQWLEQSDAWEFDDDAGFEIRVLSYNGPYVPVDIRWGEIQVPVREAASQEPSDAVASE